MGPHSSRACPAPLTRLAAASPASAACCARRRSEECGGHEHACRHRPSRTLAGSSKHQPLACWAGRKDQPNQAADEGGRDHPHHPHAPHHPTALPLVPLPRPATHAGPVTRSWKSGGMLFSYSATTTRYQLPEAAEAEAVLANSLAAAQARSSSLLLWEGWRGRACRGEVGRYYTGRYAQRGQDAGNVGRREQPSPAVAGAPPTAAAARPGAPLAGCPVPLAAPRLAAHRRHRQGPLLELPTSTASSVSASV